MSQEGIYWYSIDKLQIHMQCVCVVRFTCVEFMVAVVSRGCYSGYRVPMEYELYMSTVLQVPVNSSTASAWSSSGVAACSMLIRGLQT